jgi:hypothetical protein
LLGASPTWKEKLMPDPRGAPDPYGRAFWISTIGIAAVVLATVLVVLVYRVVQDPGKVVPAILAPVLTTIGTLVGAVAGHAAGGAGTETARAESTRAQERARAYRQQLTSAQIDDVHGRNTDLF